MDLDRRPLGRCAATPDPKASALAWPCCVVAQVGDASRASDMTGAAAV
jgi:hypothetical protein